MVHWCWINLYDHSVAFCSAARDRQNDETIREPLLLDPILLQVGYSSI